MLRSAWTKLGPGASIALLVALLAGVAVVAAGLLLPVYQWTSTSSSGEVTHGTATLVEENGGGTLVVLAVPFVMTVLVVGALLLLPRRSGHAIAWILTGLLVVLNLLAMLSFGIFVVPVTVALIVACATARRVSGQRDRMSHSAAV